MQIYFLLIDVFCITINGNKMKTIISSVFYLVCTILLFTECENNEPSSNVADNTTNKAVGTYTAENVDKAKWGDFELVLEMKKSSYKMNDVIDFELYFSNIGDKIITLPGILPVRQIESPPKINVWSAEQKFAIDKLEEELENEEEIVIEVKSKVTLIKIDLKNVEGIIWQKQNNWVQESDIIGKVLAKGTYFASASFIPAAQLYGSFTDTLTFTIE